MNSGDMTLPGKIGVTNLVASEYSVYMNSDDPKPLELSGHPGVEYSGVDWLNTKDAFIGTESIKGSTNMDYRCNIVEFDMSGEMVTRIYEAGEGELAWPEYSSRDDRYLIFTTHRIADPTIYPFEGLTPMLSLVIMDLKQNKVVTRIDSIGRSPSFMIEESPWLHSGYQFVYTIDDGPQLRAEGEEKPVNTVKEARGVYLFDVLSGEHKLLVPGGRSAIASPAKDQIAYEKENSIRVMDLTTGNETIIYSYTSKENLRGKHWTPDGKDIYFAYKYNWGVGDLFNTGEKLIEATSGKEKSFRKIGHGFSPYTWK
jgi:Tol biopolymer transport system component